MNLKLMEKRSLQADRTFENLYRELLASFDMSAVGDSIRAFVRLHKRPEILAQEEPTVEFLLGLLETSFITLYDREAINPIAEITVLGNKALSQMRTKTGIGAEEIPSPAPVLTAEQRLEAEVLSDWHNLPSAKIKAKANASKPYKAMLEKLSATDAISSQSTLHTVIGS